MNRLATKLKVGANKSTAVAAVVAVASSLLATTTTTDTSSKDGDCTQRCDNGHVIQRITQHGDDESGAQLLSLQTSNVVSPPTLERHYDGVYPTPSPTPTVGTSNWSFISSNLEPYIRNITSHSRNLLTLDGGGGSNTGINTANDTSWMRHLTTQSRPLSLFDFVTNHHGQCQCEAVSTASVSSDIHPNLDANDDIFHHQHQHNHNRRLNIQRSRTLRILTSKATRGKSLSSSYHVDWNQVPMGEGAFGHVFLATSKRTGERVALKRIPKSLASREDFQREMEALLRIQKWGGHPHICALREHFEGDASSSDEDADTKSDKEKVGGYYYLILDLVEGGEMFDHLVNHGAYSEADAARLLREVASALDFLHGIGVVHNDIKPENLMLSTSETRDGSIQLVDFGCAEVEGEDDDDDDHDIDEILTISSSSRGRSSEGGGGKDGARKSPGAGGFTPAYSPPEAFANRDKPPLPPADMWALGIIVYIMLTGVHPFDETGRATDEEIEADICNVNLPLPLGPDHPYTRHLSPSARDLIRRLMERNPKERLSAFEMLHHPWVTGKTASTNIMAGSDKRLDKFRKFKTRLQTQFFTDAVGWSDEAILTNEDETRRRTSLIERSFKAIDGSEQARKKLLSSSTSNTTSGGNAGVLASEAAPIPSSEGNEDGDGNDMTMSDYHDLLSENMQQKYFPKGHIVYKQGDRGDHMVCVYVHLPDSLLEKACAKILSYRPGIVSYASNQYFINSGTVSVMTDDGIKNKRHAGDFFGEGALLHPLKIRSATIKCKTPVHVIEISREFFDKYMASSTGLGLALREKDKIRKRNRAKALLKLQSGMITETFKDGEQLYKEGDPGDSLYIVEKGVVDITAGGHQVIVAGEGNFCGEHSLLTGRSRNTTATCMSKKGCVATRMLGRDFRKLMDASPLMKESLIDMMNRRDFKKAVVAKLGHKFPYLDPREAFDAVDVKRRGVLLLEDVAELMRNFDKNYTDGEVQSMMQTLDLSNDGQISFDEFMKIFIGDIRTTQSM